jgi:hypothetical protein
MNPTKITSTSNKTNDENKTNQKIPPLIIKKSRLYSDSNQEPSFPNSDTDLRSPIKQKIKNNKPTENKLFISLNRFTPLENSQTDEA